MSAASPKPERSVASVASIVTGLPAIAARRACTRLWPAIAAVPCPITSTRLIAPERRASSTEAGSVSDGRRTSSRPSRSMILPRSVLRNDAGASEISFRR